MPQPPRAYTDFIRRFPQLGEAWDKIREAEAAGPFDAKTRRLLKLAIAAGALREGAVSSAARKARAAGASEAEIGAVIALAASTVGLPSAVAVSTWVGAPHEGP